MKSGRGAKYYAFAPPAIEVTTEAAKATVSVDDQTFVLGSGNQIKLPSTLPIGETLIVRVRDERGAQLASQSLVLIDQVDWRDDAILLRVNEFGEPSEIPGFCGGFSDYALSDGPTAWPAFDYADPIRQLVLIGKRPGEISRWPEIPWPSWHPVWAIASAESKKAREIIYCGSAPQFDGPLLAEPVRSKKKIRQWKVQINHRRRRSASPAIPKLNELWRNYVDAASRL